jgi:hypothetical protein
MKMANYRISIHGRFLGNAMVSMLFCAENVLAARELWALERIMGYGYLLLSEALYIVRRLIPNQKPTYLSAGTHSN